MTGDGIRSRYHNYCYAHGDGLGGKGCLDFANVPVEACSDGADSFTGAAVVNKGGKLHPDNSLLVSCGGDDLPVDKNTASSSTESNYVTDVVSVPLVQTNTNHHSVNSVDVSLSEPKGDVRNTMSAIEVQNPETSEIPVHRWCVIATSTVLRIFNEQDTYQTIQQNAHRFGHIVNVNGSASSDDGSMASTSTGSGSSYYTGSSDDDDERSCDSTSKGTVLDASVVLASEGEGEGIDVVTEDVKNATNDVNTISPDTTTVITPLFYNSRCDSNDVHVCLHRTPTSSAKRSNIRSSQPFPVHASSTAESTATQPKASPSPNVCGSEWGADMVAILQLDDMFELYHDDGYAIPGDVLSEITVSSSDIPCAARMKERLAVIPEVQSDHSEPPYLTPGNILDELGPFDGMPLFM